MQAKTIKLNELSEVTQMNINKLAAILDELKDNLSDDIATINATFCKLCENEDEEYIVDGYGDSVEGARYNEWLNHLGEIHDTVSEMCDTVSDWEPVLEVEGVEDGQQSKDSAE